MALTAVAGVAGIGGAGVGGERAAEARSLRPLFEPTDLSWEDTGVVELDLQVGGIRSRAGAWRLAVPDFELDLGILDNLELDVDGAYAIEGPADGRLVLDHAVPDSLWPSLKIGLYDRPAMGGGTGFALGTQVGPKLPVASGAHGVGIESLLLLGIVHRRLHAAVNAGAFADPAPDSASVRPKGFEGGLDISVGLDAEERMSLTGELSAVRFITSDPSQMLATAGLTWSATPFLDLSLVGLAGILGGSDRYGGLIGVSPKTRLFAGPRPQ